MKVKTILKILPVCLLLAVVLFPQTKLEAQGASLFITPTRLVFDGKQKAQAVYISNNSDTAGTYRVGWTNLRMLPEGNMQAIEAETENIKFADKHVRYAPRQVNLGPSENQTVRVALRGYNGLPDGEYRSHLTFTAIPPTTDTETQAAQGLNIVINPIIAISIPVIIRKGDLNVEIAIENASIESRTADEIRMSLDLKRTGTRSAFGDLFYSWVLPDGTEKPVTQQRSVGVYNEVSSRRLLVQLPVNDEITLDRGQLKIRYLPDQTDSVQQVTETLIPLPLP